MSFACQTFTAFQPATQVAGHAVPCVRMTITTITNAAT
jgi:hypothetical protein